MSDNCNRYAVMGILTKSLLSSQICAKRRGPRVVQNTGHANAKILHVCVDVEVRSSVAKCHDSGYTEFRYQILPSAFS